MSCGAFGESKLDLPESARIDKPKVFESYMPGPMATPVVLTEKAGKDVRITTVGGMSIRQQIASNIVAGLAAGSVTSGVATPVAEIVDLALRMADSLIFQTLDDPQKFLDDAKIQDAAKIHSTPDS